MAQVTTATRVTLTELVQAVSTVGNKRTIVARGEPGIGKSWSIGALASKFPNHKAITVDCTRMLDQGDFWATYLETKPNGEKVAKQAILDMFDFDVDQPVLLQLDELGKAKTAALNVLLTVIFDRRMGNRKMHPDSIVYATTNLTTDGAGDFLPPHVRSRAIYLEIKKPEVGISPVTGEVTKGSFGEFMLKNNFDSALVAWCVRNPSCMDSYRDCPNDKDWTNPWAYHPTKGAELYFCPRSAHACDDVLKQREINGDRLTMSLLAGAAGEAFARDFSAFLMVKDKLTTVPAIVADPNGAALPPVGDAVSHCVMVQQLVQHVNKETIEPFVTYMQRMGGEWQAMFGRSVIASETKQDTAVQCAAFRNWAIGNHWMFS
jgi:hypothetical protein